mmetsp:Transcript_96498/g.245272  ORF Transcript_96498/g.245272 Transcript_96498/m.245272 type:complete len:465 (+) Transcript_96498:102-1496(+)
MTDEYAEDRAEVSYSVGLINDDDARNIRPVHGRLVRWRGPATTLSVFGLVALMLVATATWATSVRSGASSVLSPHEKSVFLGLAAAEDSGDAQRTEDWIPTSARKQQEEEETQEHRPKGHEQEAVVQADSQKQCSVKGENCWLSRCCSDPQQTCYMKDGAWAGCLDSCKMGNHPDDPEEVRTPWTCFLVQKAGPALPPPGYHSTPAPALVAEIPVPSLPGAVIMGAPADGKFPTLFCFGIIRVKTYELALIKKQFDLKASYFGCEDWAILSDIETELAPGVKTIELGDLSTGNGVRTHFANTDIFSRAFDKLKEEGRMMQRDFVVKLDPDAVFFPSILKAEIRKQVRTPVVGSPGPNIYFQNCLFQNRLWMFGAVEVLSQAALQAYFKGRDTVCKQAIDYYNMGEDTFMSRCLDRVGVEALKDFALLSDGYCDEAPGDCKSGQVTYHPFKDPMSWEACFRSATR